MDGESDKFTRYAVEALSCARRAKSDDERIGWLWLAEGWLRLLRERTQIDNKNVNRRADSVTLN